MPLIFSPANGYKSLDVACFEQTFRASTENVEILGYRSLSVGDPAHSIFVKRMTDELSAPPARNGVEAAGDEF